MRIIFDGGDKAARPWAVFGMWSILDKTLVNCGQTGALGLFIVVMAVPEESPIMVSLMVSPLLRQIEKRGYGSVA